MRCCGAIGWTMIALLLLAQRVDAQTQPPSEKLLISAKSAYNWTHAGQQILLLDGPVTITLDRATFSARQAVVWLTPVPDEMPGQQHVEIELIGDTVVKQAIATETGPQRYVTAEVLGEGQVLADRRVARDMSGSPLYRQAEKLREEGRAHASQQAAPSSGPSPGGQTRTGPTRRATRPAAAGIPVHLEGGRSQTTDTEEGTVAIVAWNGVKIFARQASGDSIELQAQKAVLFTAYQSLRDISTEQKQLKGQQAVTAVYLEGDARIEYDSTRRGVNEQRLIANQVYYEFASDRAILLDAVLHTVGPNQVPVIVRAKVLRQLSKGEFNARDVKITSSAFTVPSYGIAADRLYVLSEETANPQYPFVVHFDASNATLQAFDVPFFYLPSISGSIGDRPGALRDIGVVDRTNFGFGFLSEWGLFETLGQAPPRSIDASYRLDYFSERGPGFGLNANYQGGFVTDPGHQPWNFMGDMRSYFIYDKGTDVIGRLPVKPGDPGENYVPRGRFLYEHQHFFPDDWQAQVRLAYVSDPNFLEEWYPRDFWERGPEDVSAYIKRQRETEAFTLLVEAQPNRLVTTSDREAEQFEVERLPEIGYHRIGDDVANDSFTFFSDNTAGGYQFQPTRATLAQQGFLLPTINPGIPALGQTGITTSTVWRADFRQELDWPMAVDHIKVVPYLVGRYTEYSKSPTDNSQSRFFAAAGARFTTSFWKIDPTAQSDLFDIHQLRHVIEPELNLFTSSTTVDRGKIYEYDQQVDEINDVSAVELGLRQRWQTQRGGPGRWRSTDVFTLDLDAEFYSNKPPRKLIAPYDFRGVFFSSLPETSIPRDAFNLDASWRISDNTVVLADAQYNIDKSKLATAAVGVLVRRDVLMSWYVGNRYIADLDSNITSVQFAYQVSPKYTIVAGQAFDFGLGRDVASSVAVIRSFDRFIMSFRFSYDDITQQTGFSFSFYPIGFGRGLDSGGLQQGPFKR